VSPIEHLVDAFPEDIRFVYRHFPLNPDPNSPNQITCRADEAAGLQGQFFEYLHILYERQSDWKSLQGEDALREKLSEYAVELGLDQEQFEADLDAPEVVAKVSAAYQDAASLGLRGTPTFILNNQEFDPEYLSAPAEQWADFIEELKQQKAAFTEAEEAVENLLTLEEPPMTIDPEKTYLATVETEKGTFVIELLPTSAPKTVNNFVFLANEGWFDDITFHRVIEGFMAQTGDPSGTGMGGPGYTFEDEIDPELTFDGPGWVAMANSGPSTNGSQWFITYAAVSHLDGLHTIFGKVIEGMEVVESLTLRDPQANPDFSGDRLISVTIEEQ